MAEGEDTLVNRKELNPEASPQAAFGARLRRLREERGWTQDHVGALVGCTGRHISALETGRKSPTLPFSRRVDVALDTTNTADSFEREWRDIKHGNLLEGFPEYVGYEGRATEIRLFQIGIVPGLLQTPEYARALANGDVWRGSITPEQAEERVSFLAQRQGALTRARPPMLIAVMDESCIRRPIGGPEVMESQIQKLVDFAALPNTVLQVAPFDIGERRPFNLPVNLLTLPDRSMVSYAESHSQGNVDRESASVLPLLTGYHQLQAEALSQAASVAMIKQA
ncbi:MULTISPECIES: helix-turn-helix domain-containing protein [unclassified Streptomyces]|uniref:helix-turn-helix domain-containing protein n=1 Tax=unclassified Streptomyces TaxID=2593676 RepID=UPI00081B10B7|nr:MULTISPECIES: helix-turn-helix transcriptional regulator [unclassified Streptomyces]MEE1743256.1 helix-turn-helix transcriptional regulator [Streptomyces sp. JV184]MYQ83345.1 helix-turn-helix domain-containing protein [Streptomyces sp. SID4936]SCD64736.1 DNA-binding transcriptional regulator, XRE-family HTH domain [Streptomyces sp. DvalAA-43]